jgi:hypothetical protein
MMTLFKKSFYKIIASEISTVSRYADELIYIKHDEVQSYLFDKIDCPIRTSSSFERLQTVQDGSISLFLFNGTFNYDVDIQEKLEGLRQKMNRSSRILLILYNPFFSWLFKAAGKLGMIKGGPPATFLTKDDLADLCELTQFEVVRTRTVAIFPFDIFGLGLLLDKVLTSMPVIRNIALATVITIRPVMKTEPNDLFLSIIIPARNEAGNIENAILRLPELGIRSEVIFVEGHSKDDTWNEVIRVQSKYQHLQIKCVRQPGKGKFDAVERGLELGQGNLCTILDADLTMPPEMLPRFVNAYQEGVGDFINGSRLLYPMDQKAMRFLNKLGNLFFARSLSFVLETRLTDSLCGTKLFTKRDYERFKNWKNDFGDFDPFGDFNLLFPASSMGLGIVNLPVKYKDRTYGTTNISRFTHGLMLLKMTLVGLMKVRIRLF